MSFCFAAILFSASLVSLDRRVYSTGENPSDSAQFPYMAKARGSIESLQYDESGNPVSSLTGAWSARLYLEPKDYSHLLNFHAKLITSKNDGTLIYVVRMSKFNVTNFHEENGTITISGIAKLHVSKKTQTIAQMVKPIEVQILHDATMEITISANALDDLGVSTIHGTVSRLDNEFQNASMRVFPPALTNSELRDGLTALGNPKIAWVRPTFTSAAYSKDTSNLPIKFYGFYNKFSDVPFRKRIYSDLDKLTVTIPVTASSSNSVDAATDGLFNVSFASEVTHVDIIDDLAVHDGSIFDVNGLNKYSLLIIGHQEYVTDQEYANFQKHVTQGGRIIMLDGNNFYARVTYDSSLNSITYSRGHFWFYNSTANPPYMQKEALIEYYSNNNSQFFGFNFLPHYDRSCILSLSNNTFGYSPFEENYNANRNDKIIIDYGAEIGNPCFVQKGEKIATYELDRPAGGKIIGVGLYGDRLIARGNQSFLEFLNYLIYRGLT